MSQSTREISSNPPDKPTLPRAEIVNESRLRIVIGNVSTGIRRWWFQAVQRGHLRESLKTLVVVSILTMLIWVWAETQQMVQDAPISGVELKIISSDREKFVAVRDNASPVVTIKVTGPKTGVEEVTKDLTSTIPPKVIDIDVGSNLPVGSRTISVLDRIKDLPLFKQNGVSVTDVTPPYVAVEVDRMRTVEVDVLMPPEVADKVQNAVFEPAKVTVRGAASIVNERLPVYADLENAEALKTPGPQVIPSVRVFTRAAGIIPEPAIVQAKFDVKGDARFTKPSMTISISGPPAILDKYRVHFDQEKDFIHNVEFMGPKDVIDEMQKPNAPSPQPTLVIDSSDVNAGSRRKRLRYENLPRGVRVAPESERHEISFQLEERQQ